MEFGSEDSFDKQPVYDLRQIYAKELLGVTFKEIAYARKTKNFSLWYELIRWDLYADLYQKLTTKEREHIDKLILDTEDEISKHKGVYVRKSSNAEDTAGLKLAIWKLEVAMKELAEKHNLYGAMKEDIGL
jgi:hypothetical protein